MNNFFRKIFKYIRILLSILYIFLRGLIVIFLVYIGCQIFSLSEKFKLIFWDKLDGKVLYSNIDYSTHICSNNISRYKINVIYAYKFNNETIINKDNDDYFNDDLTENMLEKYKTDTIIKIAINPQNFKDSKIYPPRFILVILIFAFLPIYEFIIVPYIRYSAKKRDKRLLFEIKKMLEKFYDQNYNSKFNKEFFEPINKNKSSYGRFSEFLIINDNFKLTMKPKITTKVLCGSKIFMLISILYFNYKCNMNLFNIFICLFAILYYFYKNYLSYKHKVFDKSRNIYYVKNSNCDNSNNNLFNIKTIQILYPKNLHEKFKFNASTNELILNENNKKLSKSDKLSFIEINIVFNDNLRLNIGRDYSINYHKIYILVEQIAKFLNVPIIETFS